MEYEFRVEKQNYNYYFLFLLPIITLNFFRNGSNVAINILYFFTMGMFGIIMIFDLVRWLRNAKKTIMIRLVPNGIVIDSVEYGIHNITKLIIANKIIRFHIRDKKTPLSYVLNGD
jgi:hypothetical protein